MKPSFSKYASILCVFVFLLLEFASFTSDAQSLAGTWEYDHNNKTIDDGGPYSYDDTFVFMNDSTGSRTTKGYYKDGSVFSISSMQFNWKRTGHELALYITDAISYYAQTNVSEKLTDAISTSQLHIIKFVGNNVLLIGPTGYKMRYVRR